MLTSDGKPLPQGNPADTKGLEDALAKYRTDVENAARNENLAKEETQTLKAQIEKVRLASEQAGIEKIRAADVLQKRKQGLSSSFDSNMKGSEAEEGENLYVPLNRVNDIVGALKMTADQRREHAKKKTSSSDNEFAKPFHGINNT